MNTSIQDVKQLITLVLATAILASCAARPVKPAGVADVRFKLSRLEADSQLANRAPVEIKDAEQAVSAAEQPQEDMDVGNHLLFMADHKVDIARLLAQQRLMEDQRKTLAEQRDKARLDARTREADRAHQEAEKFKRELNAEITERGLVMTLGDLLFDTGRATLKNGAFQHLDKLAEFLNNYRDRTVIIEGNTDNVGSESVNQALSEDRAESVKEYLVREGVDSSRIQTNGLGKSNPIANNRTAAGRQRNRRVEVIISNPVLPELQGSSTIER